MASRRDMVNELIDRYGQLCVYCYRDLAWDEITLDHYIPKAAGGSDALENLRPSCFDCNNAKADRVPLPDGSLPPKQPQKIRAIPKSRRPAICGNCQNGRLLQAGDVCPHCQTEPSPPVRPRYLKRHPRECDHTDFWCPSCCLWFDWERTVKSGAQLATSM